MKPVSFITSRMSVKGVPGKEFQRLEPSPHLTFLLAGSRLAARPSVAASPPSAAPARIVRLFMRLMDPDSVAPCLLLCMEEMLSDLALNRGLGRNWRNE